MRNALHAPSSSCTAGPQAQSGRFHAAARVPFGIGALEIAGERVPVAQADAEVRPFGILTTFSHGWVGERQILVVAPLAGGFPVLLRDLVVGLLEHGTVSVTDWLDARYVAAQEGQFGFEDNVAYVAAMMRQLGPQLDVVAVCQGVVAALAATSLISTENPDLAPRSLTLIGGPVDPLANPSRVVRLLREHSLEWFEDNVIEAVPIGYPGEGRLIYPAWRQLMTFSGYLARHVIGRGELFWKLLRDDGDDPIHFSFLKLCLLQMDLTAQHFLENVHNVFHKRALLTGEVIVQNTRIDLKAIRHTALMTIEGEHDDIAAPGQTYAAHAACSCIPEERHAHLLVPGSGHFSLFHGEVLRRIVLPTIAGFFERSADR